MGYNHGDHLASRFILDPDNYEGVLPLVMPPSRRASWLSHCLSLSSHCTALLSSCHANWLMHCLSLSSCCATILTSCFASLLSHHLSLLSCPATSRCLVVPACCCTTSWRAALSSSCRIVVLPLIVLLHQLVVASSYLVVLLLHIPLVLSVALPLLAPPTCPLIIVHRRRHQTLSNAAAAIKHHPLNTVSIIHRCHSCRPLPQSNPNANLCPSPPSNADTRRRHPPLLTSISIVTLSSPIRSPHRHCHRTLLLPLNDIIIVHRHWTLSSSSTAAAATATGVVNSFTTSGAYMHQLINWASWLLNNFSNFCPLAMFDS